MLNQTAVKARHLNGDYEKLFYEKLEVKGEQGDTADKQFAFPTQCLVLGDSRVGKTSLVRSLTGEPFDLEQPKTEGIDHSLVDHKWKNCNLTDLIFGDLWRFLTTGEMEVALIGTGRANSPVVIRQFDVFTGLFRWLTFFNTLLVTTLFLIGALCNFPVAFLLFHYIYHGHLIFQSCAFPILCFHSKLRFILATFVFILSRRGLIIGLYLGYFLSNVNESLAKYTSTRAFIFLLGTGAGISFLTFFLCIGPPFGTGQLVKNQNFIVILCFYRLPLSILIGFICSFVIEMSFTSLYQICFEQPYHETTPCLENIGRIIYNLLSSFLWEFPTVFLDIKYVRCIISSIKKESSWVHFITLLIVVVFYHCKLALTSPDFYFLISFPLYICFTLYHEWFCSNSASHNKEYLYLSNRFMTLALMGNGEMNTKMLKSALKQKFPSLKLKILDFAGDKEYYAFHHMFLRRQAIYVIVFNMATFVENNFRYRNACTARLQFWLESVCSHVPPKTPIFLVGTHRGELDKNCMESLNCHLMKNVWDFFCDELVVNDVNELIFFPVENSKGENDVGIHSLQTKITSVAEESLATIDCDIPLSWITIQDAIIQLREKKEAKFCVTVEEFPMAFDKFICTNWSEETLKYFHEKGLIIYIDKDEELSKWVLLKPEILVSIIIQLVTPPPQMMQERGFRRDWKLLKDKGMLTKSLLESITSNVQENKEAMTAFLEEYDLICPLLNKKVQICSLSDDEEHQPTHFVPSMLPMSADGCIPVWNNNATDKTFYVLFTRFLPEPLFHCLLSRAHKNSKVEFPNGPTVVFRDVGKFWMSPSQPYRLKLVKKEGVIEVTFSNR